MVEYALAVVLSIWRRTPRCTETCKRCNQRHLRVAFLLAARARILTSDGSPSRPPGEHGAAASSRAE